jgi:glycosyltransferase involved in cell wall biosynthesis
MEFNLWIESFTPPISTSFLPLGTSRPVVGLVHMLSGDDMERKYHLPFSIIENIGLKFYKNYVVLTDVSKAKVILANPRANVYVIPNGVDTIQNARDKICKTGVKHLLFMGRIEFNQKGLDLLIGAFSRISQNSDLDLQIAGTGSSEDLKQLENLLDKKRIRDRVRVLGRIEGRKKSDYFKNSFAIVIPSRYETFSLTALEAMSFGKPIVCFDIDGMRWLPPSCAVKVKAFDEGDYASQIMRLRQDDNARKKIARSQREEIKKYSWGQVAKRYGDVISDFLNNNAANN